MQAPPLHARTHTALGRPRCAGGKPAIYPAYITRLYDTPPIQHAAYLSRQVENLREELEATQKAYQDKMDLARSKLEAEWENKLAAQQREGSALAAAALAAAEAAARDQLAALRRAHEEEVARLQVGLDLGPI